MGKRARNRDARISPVPLPRTAPWPELEPHQPVRLVDIHGATLAGILDEMTEDRSTMWIQLDGGKGRQLIHRLDGYELEGMPEAEKDIGLDGVLD